MAYDQLGGLAQARSDFDRARMFYIKSATLFVRAHDPGRAKSVARSFARLLTLLSDNQRRSSFPKELARHRPAVVRRMIPPVTAAQFLARGSRR